MSKVMYLTMLFLFSLLPNYFSSPPLPDQTDNVLGGGSQQEFLMDESCKFYKTFYVLVSNLDILNNLDCDQPLPSGPLGQPGATLPTGYPPMKLRFKVDGQQEVIVDADFFSLYLDCSSTMPNAFLFSYEMAVDFSYQQKCNGTNPDQLLEAVFTSEILKEETDGTLVPYPICDYTAPGDIFACDYFDETANFCTPDHPFCDSPYLATYSQHVRVRCNDCVYSANSFVSNSNDEIKLTYQQLLQADEGIEEELSFTVNPNPFLDRFHVHWRSASNVVNIRLYNSSGQVVEQWSEQNFERGDVLTLDSDGLSNGMYYLHVQSGEESKYLKLIKS